MATPTRSRPPRPRAAGVIRALQDPAAGEPLLTRLRLLTNLDDAEIEVVRQLLSVPVRLAPKAEIGSRGEGSRRLHVLLDGWAFRYRLLVDGSRQITAILLPGDICDLDAMHMRSSEFSVATLTPCTVARVEIGAVRDAIVRHPRLGDVLGWLGALENAMLAERNACLGRRSAREHVTHLLCELLVRLSVVGRAHDGRFALPMTQEEVSDVIGLTSVHVNRTLQALRGDGHVERRGHDVVIRDLASLRKAAGFRPDYLHLEGCDGAGRAIRTVPSELAPTQHQPMLSTG